jgi:hypothetical protein
MKLSERITIDDERDVVTVDGFKFSGEFLTEILARPTLPGVWHRIASVENKVIIVDTIMNIEDNRPPVPPLEQIIQEAAAQ